MPRFAQGQGQGGGAGGGAGGGGGGGAGGGQGRGPGRGRGRGGGFRMGPGGNCLCPACGHKIPHEQGVPCFEVNCPQCGGVMTRER